MRSPLAILAALALLTTGCAVQAGDPAPVPAPTATPTPSPIIDPLTLGPVDAAGEPTVIATGFSVPWSMVRLKSGSTLVSERDTALVKEVLADGSVREVGAVAGVVPEGEGGLLGLEFWDGTLFAYVTAASDNRIVAIDLLGAPGSYALGEMTDVLTGIPKWSTHNGGRIKVGPDEKLYATVGDVQNRPSSQDLASLSGKILRMELDGTVPTDNPFEGSLVYSLGHRNPQGIAWDRDGQLWAAEFNIITAGANYGWPIVEGIGSDPAYVNPVYQWSTDAASPSGLVFTRDTFFLAALRGQRVWGIYPTADGTTATEFYTGQFGRIRDVIAGPDGTLWLLTNNTGGRGEPREGDDRILQVELVPRSAG
jgi:glucose/arabinose dehydrogenase